MNYLLCIALVFCHLTGWTQDTLFPVLISEVMSDPTPSVGLPDCEFVELYNNSEDSVQMHGWTWMVGEKSVHLTEAIISPWSCLVLVRSGDENLVACKTLGLTKWLSLRNSGQYLVLKDPSGQIVHFTSYSQGQYHDVLQRDGGWSLELSCLDKPCDPDSWQVSKEVLGGSPGFLTASYCPEKSHSVFKASRCAYLSDQEIIVLFSQPLLPSKPLQDLIIIPDHHKIMDMAFFDDRCDQIILKFDSPIAPGMTYHIDVGGPVLDCNGRNLEPSLLKYGLPGELDSGKLIITEIMFDPDDTGLEYIEVFNLSDQILDLNQVLVATVDDLDWVKDFSREGDGSFLLFPQEYGLFCDDIIWFSKKYPEAPVETVSVRADLPALNNSGGGIRLLTQSHELIEEVVYDPDWHDDRLPDESGVSLERMNYHASGRMAGNWYSAAANVGHATPGCENSQMLYPAGDQYDKFKLSSDVVSQDSNGNDDLVIVQLKIDEPGYTGRFEVRHPSGILIRLIQDWDVLPISGQLYWDGLNEFQHPVPTGIYILIIHYTNANGTIKRWKKACAVID